MPTEVTKAVSQSKRGRKALVAATKPSIPSAAQRDGKNITAPRPGPLPNARRTKKEIVLALLGRTDGATIADLIEVTSWQQHSVRGFLAGTVKKKLGLALTSSKDDGGLRRYRIVTKLGR